MMKYFFTMVLSIVCTVSSIQARDSISVFFFLLDDCVICQDYGPTLEELHTNYGADFSFVGYFPNFSSKSNKIKEFKERYDITFPLKTDYFKEQCSKYEATITPEVVVYNHTAERKLYQGRIDNSFFKIGKRRKVVTEHDLIDVLEAIRNDNLIKTTKTEPIGCYINYSDAISRHQIK